MLHHSPVIPMAFQRHYSFQEEPLVLHKPVLQSLATSSNTCMASKYLYIIANVSPMVRLVLVLKTAQLHHSQTQNSFGM